MAILGKIRGAQIKDGEITGLHLQDGSVSDKHVTGKISKEKLDLEHLEQADAALDERIDRLEETIGDTTSNITQEIENLKAADQTLQENIDNVVADLEAHKQAYDTKVGELEAEDVRLADEIQKLKDSVGNKNSNTQVFADMAAFEAYTQEADYAPKKGDIAFVISVKKSYIYNGTTLRYAEDITPPMGWVFFDEISNEIDLEAYAKKVDVEAADQALQDAIDAEVARAEAAEADLQGKIDILNGDKDTVGSVQNSIQVNVFEELAKDTGASLIGVDTTLFGDKYVDDDNIQAVLEQITADIESIIGDGNSGVNITTLDERVTVLEQEMDTAEAKIVALETLTAEEAAKLSALTDRVTENEASITRIDAKDAEQDSRLDAIEAAIGKAPVTEPDGSITPGSGILGSLEDIKGEISAADDKLREDLASNENGKGASLIGIEDADSKFTATTVEGALNELVTKIDDAVSNGVEDIKNILGSNVQGTDATLAERLDRMEGVDAGLRADLTDTQDRVSAIESEIELATGVDKTLAERLQEIEQSANTVKVQKRYIKNIDAITKEVVVPGKFNEGSRVGEFYEDAIRVYVNGILQANGINFVTVNPGVDGNAISFAPEDLEIGDIIVIEWTEVVEPAVTP